MILGFASLVTHPGGDLEPVAFLANTYLSPAMLVVFVLAVVSMIISTATSAVLAPATILGHNLLARISFFQNRKPLFRDRLSVVLVSLGGISVAMLGESLMGLLDIALSIQLSALFVPVVCGIYGRPKNQACCVLAMLFGCTAWSGTYANEVFSPAYPQFLLNMQCIPSDFYGVTASIFGYGLGSWISQSVHRPRAFHLLCPIKRFPYDQLTFRRHTIRTNRQPCLFNVPLLAKANDPR